MKITAISDLHGHLPHFEEINQSEVLFIAGDICPNGNAKQQLYWLETKFKVWLNTIKIPVFGIAGNHDWPFFSEKFPELKKRIDKIGLNWTYLQDSGAEIHGFKIWGTPWQPEFFDWAFNLKEQDLAEKFKLIPLDTDILISHGPPHGYGDYVIRDNENVGSVSLLNRIKDVNPKLCIFGHIHENRGVWESEKTIFVNVTIVNERYKMVYRPFEYELCGL